MNKRGRPKGKSINTCDQESAVYAAYRILRAKGFSHRKAVSELSESITGHDLNSIVKRFEYRPYHRTAPLGASRIAAIVTKRNTVTKRMKDYLKIWEADFKSLCKGRVDVIVSEGPSDLLFSSTTKQKISKNEWKEAVKSFVE